MLQVDVLEGALVLASRPIGRYDNVLVGPSTECEVLTDRVPVMIPMIRSSPGGKGWELVYPRSLHGHVTAAGRTRSLLECAADASARSDGDLAVFPLPEGAKGGIELGPILVRFREMPDADTTTLAPRASEDSQRAAIGIAVVACFFVVSALLLGRTGGPGAATEIASATPIATASPTSAGGTPGPDATPDATPDTTAVAVGATPGETTVAIGGTPTPLGTAGATPTRGGTAVAVGATPTPKGTAVAIGATPTPRSTAAAIGATPTPRSTAAAIGATPTPRSTAAAIGATPTPKATALAASASPTPRAANTPIDRDPLALAVGTPRVVAKATPARTPKPTGFLSEAPSLDDEQRRFEDRLGAVPTMTPSKAGLALDGGAGAVDGSLGASGIAATAGGVRDGGKGVVGHVEVGPAGSGDVRVASAGKVETPVEARVTTDAPTLTGTIDAGRVQAVVQEATAAFRQCYEAALRRNTRLAGKAVLTWRIVEDGAVEDVGVASSTLRDEEIERCLMTRVRSLRFPRPDGGTVGVEFPMVFYPAVDPT